jgi:hypothetical protein
MAVSSGFVRRQASFSDFLHRKQMDKTLARVFGQYAVACETISSSWA